jgi:Ca2+-binding RTX toxin-like protein
MADIYGDAADNNLVSELFSDVLYGEGGDDDLWGRSTASVFGGDGDDTLRGRTLSGGAGADRFIIEPNALSSSLISVISDFVSGVDTVFMYKGTATGELLARVPAGIVTDNMLRAGPGVTTAVEPDDFFIYNTQTGMLYVDRDANGRENAVALARMEVPILLRASDIEVVAFNALAGTDGNDRINGTSGQDAFVGGSGNDAFYGGSGDDRFEAGAGIDMAVYAGSSADFQIHDSPRNNYGSDVVVADANTADRNEGIDVLQSVERLRFQNHNVALDVYFFDNNLASPRNEDANAGAVAKTIGAVFGAARVHDMKLVGEGLYLLDRMNDSPAEFGVDRQNYQALMQIALDAKLGPNPTDRQVVDLLYTNVAGTPPPDAEAQHLLDVLANGTYTHATLGMYAADRGQNLLNIDFVGLIANGLPYQEIVV